MQKPEINDLFAQLAREILNEYGVIVNDVSFDWNNVSTNRMSADGFKLKIEPLLMSVNCHTTKQAT